MSDGAKRSPREFLFQDGAKKLVVMAPSLRSARKHVRSQAASVLWYRSLKYVGEGPPSNPDNWLAARLF